jgi:predicted nucleic acid-binding Zn finger protein
MHTFSTATSREARVEEKAIAIAAELRKGGEYVAYECGNGVYGMMKKSYSTAPDMSYAITLGETPTCTCPDFAAHQNFCKHIRGLQIAQDMDAQEEAQVREYEEYQARLEPFGFDPCYR